jgi:hypothetical protein
MWLLAALLISVLSCSAAGLNADVTISVIYEFITENRLKAAVVMTCWKTAGNCCLYRYSRYIVPVQQVYCTGTADILYGTAYVLYGTAGILYGTAGVLYRYSRYIVRHSRCIVRYSRYIVRYSRCIVRYNSGTSCTVA